jgi:hypothetical protein
VGGAVDLHGAPWNTDWNTDWNTLNGAIVAMIIAVDGEGNRKMSKMRWRCVEMRESRVITTIIQYIILTIII